MLLPPLLPACRQCRHAPVVGPDSDGLPNRRACFKNGTYVPRVGQPVSATGLCAGGAMRYGEGAGRRGVRAGSPVAWAD